jgi:hypothetical protein
MFLWNRFCKCRFSNDTPTNTDYIYMCIIYRKNPMKLLRYERLQGGGEGEGWSQQNYVRTSYVALTKLLPSSYQVLTKL